MPKIKASSYRLLAMLDISDSLGDLANILKTKGNVMFNQSNVNSFIELVANI